MGCMAWGGCICIAGGADAGSDCWAGWSNVFAAARFAAIVGYDVRCSGWGASCAAPSGSMAASDIIVLVPRVCASTGVARGEGGAMEGRIGDCAIASLMLVVSCATPAPAISRTSAWTSPVCAAMPVARIASAISSAL